MKYIFTLLVLSVSVKSFSYPSSEFMTFWGGFKRILSFSNLEGEVYYLKPPQFITEVKVYVREVKNIAPVIVVFPGVFGEPTDAIMPKLIHEMESLNTHVISVPNSLSTSYLKAKPKAQSDLWNEEINFQLQIVQETLKKIPDNKRTSIIFISESLGTWQSIPLIISKQMNVKSAFFISPILNVQKTMLAFDKKLVDFKPTYDACSFWYKWPLALYRFYRDTPPSEMDKNEQDCYGAFGLHRGFVEKIKEVSHDVSGIDKDKAPITFSTFSSQVAPDLHRIVIEMPENLSVAHWVDQISSMNMDVNFISSQDDFLNDMEDWKILQAHPYLKNRIQLYPYGGHSGLTGTRAFWASLVTKIKEKL